FDCFKFEFHSDASATFATISAISGLMHRSKMHLHSIERVAGEPPHGPCNPFCGRICCDVDPDKVSACEPDDDQDIEQVEANGRNNEHVHGGDVRCVVTQEGAPSLGRRSTSLDHILRDAGLSDLEAELEQLAMDTEARKI
ncbi:MAG TPA: hypothetical protein VI010_07055, partial [Xanthobacteraceae bacterium]